MAISDATTGDVFYEQNAETGEVTTNNTNNMVTTVASSSTDIDKIKTHFENFIKCLTDTTSSNEDFKTNMAPFYADDYLNNGHDKTAELESYISDRSGSNDYSYIVNNIVIGGSFKDYTFEAATATKSQLTKLDAGTYTFNAGSASIGLGSNYKAVKVYYDVLVTYKGETRTEHGMDYFVQNTKDDNWKYWGNRSLSNHNSCSTDMGRRIYNQWDGSTYVTKDVLYSGYNVYCDDIGNALRDKGITALLILGEGITTEYAPGKKGILIMEKNFPDTYYIVANVTFSSNYNNVYGEDEGLDISAITNSEITIIGLSYNDSTKTFTPVRYWLDNADQERPLSIKTGEITKESFPTFNLTSTKISDNGIPLTGLWNPSTWSQTVSWTAPTKSGLKFNDFYYSMSGNPVSTSVPGTADTSIWIDEDSGDSDLVPVNNSYTVSNTTSKIFMLNQIWYSVSYYDASGRRFQTEYSLSKY